MKKLILITVFLIGAFTLNAKVLIVNNNTSSAGQYTNSNLAITDASVGDTIYFVGSPTSYGNIIVNKKLTLIGEGYVKSGEKDYSNISTIGSLTFDTASYLIQGTVVRSLYIDGNVNSASGDDGRIHNITLDRCYTNSYLHVRGTNWLIKNCVIGYYLYINYYDNILVTNNIFLNNVYNSNKSTVRLINNLFYNNYSFNGISNIVVENSLFYRYNITTNACNGCVFNNNLSYDDVVQTLPPTDATGNNNISSTNPQFVTDPGLSTGLNVTELKLYTWKFQTGSPCIGAGTDGKDIGIFGGAFPMPNITGVSNLPFVQYVRLANPVVEKDAVLKVNVKAYNKK